MRGTVRDARVVITGATSGIGKAAALELARQGAQLTIVCRNEDKGAATVAELRDAVPGLSADVVRCDLADLDSVRRAGYELADRYDAIDVLVNNAGCQRQPVVANGRRFRPHDGLQLPRPVPADPDCPRLRQGR